MSTNRRDFCKKSLTLAAGAGIVTAMPATLTGCNLFNNKIVVGVVGVKGMGFTNLRAFIKNDDVQVGGLCDVDQNILKKRAAEVEELTGKKPRLYTDYRKMLEERDIDAVIVGTPDHWHCLIAVHAMEAGKDVYLEKPMANTIGESLIVAAAAKRYNKVVQIGQWQRSDKHWLEAMQYVHSGQLGNIRSVKSWAYLDWLAPQLKENGPIPEGVDYDFWLGPAKERAYNPNRFHFHFRWWWDYAGGLMTDWGVHLLDFAIYGMKAKHPKSVMATGGHFSIDPGAMETPDTQTTIYEFDDFMLQWEHAVGVRLGPHRREHGLSFIGDNATLVVDRGGYEVLLERKGKKEEMVAVPYTKGDGLGHVKHVRNFLDCVKSRERTVCDAEIGKDVAVLSHMGNIAYRSQDKLIWDAENYKFNM